MRGVCLRTIALAAALLACAACASHPRAAVSNGPPPPDPRTQMAALEIRIYDLVQAERHAINPQAKGLMLDSELIGAARRHSLDMAQKNYLAHTAPNGETTSSIIMDEDADFQGLLGENIALEHFSPKTGVNVNQMAQEFVNLWLQSPKHRENLSIGVYDRTGVGAAVVGDTVYVTQLFATDLGLPPPPPQQTGNAAEQRSAPVSGAGAGDSATTTHAPAVPAGQSDE